MNDDHSAPAALGEPAPRGTWWAMAVLAADGTIDRVNPALCQLMGSVPDQLVGRRFVDAVCTDGLAPEPEELRDRTTDGVLTTRTRTAVTLVNGRRWEGEVAATAVQSTGGDRELHLHLFEGGRRGRTATGPSGAGDIAMAIDQMRVGIALVNVEGRAVAVNRALCEITGQPADVLVGGLDLRTLTHPDDVEEDMRLAVRLGSGELDSYVVDKRLLRPDGQVVWVRQEVTVVVDDDDEIVHLIAQIIDITDQKRIEHELEATRTRYVELVERMPVGILSSDADGLVVTANSAAAAIAGLDEIPAGFRVDEIMHPDDLAPAWRTIVERVHAGLDFHIEFRIVRPDGTHRWVRNDAHPQLDDAGRFLGLTGTWLDISGIRAAEDLLRRQAIEDQLTGLGNRRFLFDRLDVEIKAAASGGRRPTVLFVDLDGFKAINDAGGHGVGDLVLVEVAERLRGALGDDDAAARIGGDEFVVCCPVDGALPTRAEDLAATLVATLAEPFVVDGSRYHLGASIGIADWRPGLAPDDLVNLADRGVYRAKRDGRGCWRRA